MPGPLDGVRVLDPSRTLARANEVPIEALGVSDAEVGAWRDAGGVE